MPTTSGSNSKVTYRRSDPSAPLGPQCVRCRRRRVKCDSRKPGCTRCERDKFDCPGYGAKPAAWTVKTQASMARGQDSGRNGTSDSFLLQSRSASRVANAGTGVSSPHSGSQDPPPMWYDLFQSQLDHLDEPTRNQRLALRGKGRKSTLVPVLSDLWDPLLPLLMPPLSSTPSMSAADRAAYVLSDCLSYYNARMRPLIVGCLLPSHPRGFELVEWMTAPLLMKHATVFAMVAHRVARGEDQPNLQMLLHVHRGRTVELLRQALVLLGNTAWAALSLIVMFLGAELGICAVGGWEPHYDAAWSILEVQGGEGGIDEGITTCWTLGAEPRLACIYLIQIEIFSGTTAPVWTLAAARDRRTLQILQREDLQDLEDRLLMSTCPCPLQIATAVCEINDLRSALYRLRVNGSTSQPGQRVNIWSTRLWHALMQLLCFRAEPWVDRVLERHESGVAHAVAEGGFSRKAMAESWVALANCYRSAAIVYLIRACSSCRLSKALPDECKEFFNDAENILDEHRRALSEALAFLLQGFSAPQHSVKRPILWRFVTWPLFVEAYEATGWPLSVGQANKDGERLSLVGRCSCQDTLIEQHRRLAKELGAACLSDAADLLKNVQKEQAVRQTWDWDDAFPGRVVFAM